MSINYSNSFEESVVTSASIQPEDRNEASLRPKTIAEYVGQEKAKDNLSVFIEAARKRPTEVQKRLNNFIEKTRDGRLITGYGGIEKYYG